MIRLILVPIEESYHENKRKIYLAKMFNETQITQGLKINAQNVADNTRRKKHTYK